MNEYASGAFRIHILAALIVFTTPIFKLEIRKWPYLSQMVENQKIKSTLLPSTLKVQENKVTLVVWFLPIWLRYGLFLVFVKFSNVAFIELRNTHHSQFLTPSSKQNPNRKWKIKALCFLEMLKSAKRKCLQICLMYYVCRENLTTWKTHWKFPEKGEVPETWKYTILKFSLREIWWTKIYWGWSNDKLV